MHQKPQDGAYIRDGKGGLQIFSPVVSVDQIGWVHSKSGSLAEACKVVGCLISRGNDESVNVAAGLNKI
jgi:hypothetical protein